nr:plasmid replication protein, CyRepA1 family [Coleofasciculus sp. FACHB-SPT9]
MEEWGCLKPDLPRKNANGKSVKYEHPPGQAARAFFLRISFKISLRIARQYGLETEYWKRFPHFQSLGKGFEISRKALKCKRPRPLKLKLQTHRKHLRRFEDKGFWAWVLENNLPIVLTEGSKKAGSLLSAGYAAVGLPGIWNGRRVIGSIATLIPELQLFATEGRLIYFCFDHDTKPKTIAAVNSAIAKTGKLFVDAGCNVHVISWSAPEKGVDDFIIANGQAAFDEVYSKALPLQQWQWTKRQERSLTHSPSVVLNVPDLSIIGLQVPDSGIVAIKSGKGSGKTKLIAQITDENPHLVSLTHRTFLGRSLAERLKYTWRTDCDKGLGYYLDSHGRQTWRIGSCVESLLSINPEKFVECDLVIDEVTQVLRNLLTSGTCNKDGMRPALLARLHWLIKVAKRIIIADADLDNFTLNYIRALRGDDAPVYLIRNDYKSTGYPCTILDSPDHGAIMNYAVSAVQAGKRLLISTDSKGASEIVSELVVAGVKLERILVINGDTSEQAIQREYVSQINKRVSNYDVLIATNSLGTGVSIEQPWFDEVIGIYYGVLGDGDIAQAQARVRAPIRRTMWIAKRGKNFNRVSKSEYPSVVKQTLKTRWEGEVALIRSSLNPDLVPFVDAPIDWDGCPHKQLWAQAAADTNFAMWNLRDCVIARLKHEGNQVQVISSETTKDFKTLVKEIKQQIKLNHYNEVATATILSPEEREPLQARECHSTEERLNLEKTAIAEFACTDEVSPELVEAYPKLAAAFPRYEDLRYNLAIARDERAIARQVKWGQGLFIPDLPTREQERIIRERLGLIEWIDRLLAGETFTNEDLEPLGKLVRNYYRQVNEVLKLGFSPDCKQWSNVRIFNKLVKQLGIPTVTKRLGKEKVATTSLDLERWKLVERILERREAQRQLLNQQKEFVTSPMVVEEMKQVRGDNGSYINKQVSMSPQSNVTPMQIETERAFTQEEIQDGANLLMMADTPELVIAVFDVLRKFSPWAKQAVWARLPRDKRAELWHLTATG